MSVTLPIPNRDLTVHRLNDAEINAMMNAYVAAAADPMTLKFATGLAAYLANRRELAYEIAYKCAFPEVVQVDQHGGPSPMLDDYNL